MKCKNISFFIFLLILLVSCGTTKIVFDDSISIEETAIIQPSVSVTVISFNGNRVNWSAGTWRGNDFIIPSGEADLIVNITTEIGNTLYTGGRLNFTYNFYNGNKYLLICRRIYVDEVEADIEIRNLTTNTREIVRARGNNL
ncbi:MAG: hypothetical protein LBQ93_09350 [Treponema sp.]|jgi:hypothetical protein|nr:hypothetical protein [Treponema sp.]